MTLIVGIAERTIEGRH